MSGLLAPTPSVSFLKESDAKNFIFASLAIAPFAGAYFGVTVGVVLLSVLLYKKAGAFRASRPTHGRLAEKKTTALNLIKPSPSWECSAEGVG